MSQLFDKVAFQELTGGDSALTIELIGLFNQEWPELLKQIRSALEKGEAKALERSAHRLKGNLRNFFASEMAAKAEILEQAGHDGRVLNLEPTLAELTRDLTTLNSQLLDYSETLQK